VSVVSLSTLAMYNEAQTYDNEYTGVKHIRRS